MVWPKNLFAESGKKVASTMVQKLWNLLSLSNMKILDIFHFSGYFFDSLFPNWFLPYIMERFFKSKSINGNIMHYNVALCYCVDIALCVLLHFWVTLFIKGNTKRPCSDMYGPFHWFFIVCNKTMWPWKAVAILFSSSDLLPFDRKWQSMVKVNWIVLWRIPF